MEREAQKGKELRSGRARRSNLCPLIDEPCSECFCSDLRSQNIEAAIRYCSGNFEECEIFKRRGGRGQNGQTNQEV